jgi:DNA-binding transcriptional LysR family regulator
MARNETRLMESALVLSEELHFSRAARKLGISQPQLTKNIQDLETLVGGPLFVRDRKTVRLNDAGRAYVQQARLSLLYGERAVQAARTVMQGADTPLFVGRCPYTDPFLISTLRSIELPLYPRLKIELSSQYSLDLMHGVLAGTLDFAFAMQLPESPLISKVQVAESPFYIAMARRDELAAYPTIKMEMLTDRRWIIFERQLHPPLYDSILRAGEQRNVRPSNIQHVTAPEEAFPFVAEGSALVFLVKAGALLMARNGVTVRPLDEPELYAKTYLMSRADNESKIAGEIVRTFMRKLSDVNKYKQLSLPISA